jgi:hypothetical protein
LALADEQALTSALGRATKEEFESSILPLSRVPGVNVLVLAGLLLQELLGQMEVYTWIGGDINNLPRTSMADRPEDFHVLPSPGSTVNGMPTKYMIFSDVHRDAPQDIEFRVGHFSDNEDLFLRVLDWCDTNGYTVVENGDCEELWYVPTFEPSRRQSKLARLQAIVALHGPVYAKLSSLAARGRYHRCIGNHDSYEWEDSDVVAWRAANPFPSVHGGFIIPDCKTMDDFLPHLGLDPDSYAQLADMLMMHGHQFDFWNCDEHNRLGKFITNAVGVPPDAFDDVVYDYRGVDRLGHPLVEFWDVLAPLDPWNNWPPEETARQWAEELENRRFSEILTKDSIIFSETTAALIAYLLRSGPMELQNYSVLLCLGHTHNPVCRPWIPFLERFNPWRDETLFGIPVYQNLFALKSRYMSTGPTGWWQHIVWAIEITEAGQPRMLYWAEEDTEPVYMDWELQDAGSLPSPPFAALLAWARQYLETDVRAGLDAAAAAGTALQPVLSVGGQPLGQGPDMSTLATLLSNVARQSGQTRPGVPLVSAAALGALSRAGVGSQLETAGRLLAARHDPVFGGVRQPSDTRSGFPGSWGLPNQAGLEMQPLLLSGCTPSDQVPSLDLDAVLRGLFPSFWATAPPAFRPPLSEDAGLRVSVPGHSPASVPYT